MLKGQQQRCPGSIPSMPVALSPNMKLKPLIVALGMRPEWWMARFSFMSKQTYWDDKISLQLYEARQRQRDEITGMIFVEAARILDAQPVPTEGRMIV